MYIIGVSLLNKTKWRGKELKIEEAKPDYMQRYANNNNNNNNNFFF